MPKRKSKLWLMDLKDKVIISNTRFCPAHYFPHKLPSGEKIKTEKCHYHNSWYHILHHKPFCKVLRCKNYKFMMSKYQKRKK